MATAQMEVTTLPENFFPVEGQVFFVQPDDVDLHQHEASGLVRL